MKLFTLYLLLVVLSSVYYLNIHGYMYFSKYAHTRKYIISNKYVYKDNIIYVYKYLSDFIM